MPRKVKLGRPLSGEARTVLGRGLDGLLLRLCLHRMGLNQGQFSELMGSPPGTISRWMMGRSKGPAWPDIRAALQDARSGRMPSPLDQPHLWIKNPESRSTNLQKLSQDQSLDSPLCAAQAVQNLIGTAPLASGHQPILELDRIAATAAVEDEEAFVTMMKTTLQPMTMSRDSLYRWSGRTQHGLFVQAGPRFQNERVDPETGEILEPSFVRVDISGQLLRKAHLLRSRMETVFGPFVEWSSWQVTLIDFAATYNEPHLAILSLDRRVWRTTIRRPGHRALRDLAINHYFGSKRSSRYIRAYNKRTETADKLLTNRKTGPEVWEGLCQRHVELFDGFDEELIENLDCEPDGDSVVSDLQFDEAHGQRWPASIRRWLDAHRIEASIKPSSASKARAYDRHPSGLVGRIIERANPFTHHQVVHLGVVDPSSTIAPLLVWARIEGLQSVLRDIKAASKTRPERDAFRRLLFEELETLADSTEWYGFVHPDVLLRVHADRLQRNLDELFGRASRRGSA